MVLALMQQLKCCDFLHCIDVLMGSSQMFVVRSKGITLTVTLAEVFEDLLEKVQM